MDPPHHWSNTYRSIYLRSQTCLVGRVVSISPKLSFLAQESGVILSSIGETTWRKSGQIIHGTHGNNCEYSDIDLVADRSRMQPVAADWRRFSWQTLHTRSRYSRLTQVSHYTEYRHSSNIGNTGSKNLLWKIRTNWRGKTASKKTISYREKKQNY